MNMWALRDRAPGAETPPPILRGIARVAPRLLRSTPFWGRECGREYYCALNALSVGGAEDVGLKPTYGMKKSACADSASSKNLSQPAHASFSTPDMGFQTQRFSQPA